MDLGLVQYLHGIVEVGIYIYIYIYIYINVNKKMRAFSKGCQQTSKISNKQIKFLDRMHK